MNSTSMCSNTLYMSNMDVGSSLRWLSASTMTITSFWLHKWPRTPKSEPSWVGITVYGCYHMPMDSISMCPNTLWARGAIVIAIYIDMPLRSFFRSDMVRSWQTEWYLFLRHFYRYEKARDVREVFVSYVSTWSYVGIKRIPVGPNGFRLNLWIFWKIFLGEFFSVFPKNFTDKPQYDTFLDYWIIKNVTTILIAG